MQTLPQSAPGPHEEPLMDKHRRLCRRIRQSERRGDYEAVKRHAAELDNLNRRRVALARGEDWA